MRWSTDRAGRGSDPWVVRGPFGPGGGVAVVAVEVGLSIVEAMPTFAWI